MVRYDCPLNSAMLSGVERSSFHDQSCVGQRGARTVSFLPSIETTVDVGHLPDPWAIITWFGCFHFHAQLNGFPWTKAACAPDSGRRSIKRSCQPEIGQALFWYTSSIQDKLALRRTIHRHHRVSDDFIPLLIPIEARRMSLKSNSQMKVEAPFSMGKALATTPAVGLCQEYENVKEEFQQNQKSKSSRKALRAFFKNTGVKTK